MAWAAGLALLAELIVPGYSLNWVVLVHACYEVARHALVQVEELALFLVYWAASVSHL